MARKKSSRRENKRLDHKSERAAVKRAIDGGPSRQPTSTSWSHAPGPVPVTDRPSTGSKHKKKGCPKNKGGKHVAVYKPHRWVTYVCKYCGKRKWGGSNRDWETIRFQPARPIGRYCVVMDGGDLSGVLHSQYFTEEKAIRAAHALTDQGAKLGLDVRYIVVDSGEET